MRLLRLEKGEVLHVALRNFAHTHDIRGAYFSAIGGVENIAMGYYDMNDREYKLTTYDSGVYELVSLTGNIAWKDGEPMAHIHAVLSDQKNQCLGGHVGHMEVAITCEVTLWICEHMELARSMHDDIGLPLWDLGHCGAE